MSGGGDEAGRFTTGATMRHVAVMTLTGSVGLTFMFLVDFITLLYVSMLEDEGLTSAVGYAWTIQFFTISVGIGFSIAAMALVSRALGARQRVEARRRATSALTLTCLVLALTAVLVFLERDALLTLMGARGESHAVASRFLAITLPSLPLMAFGMVGSSILRAEGDARRAMMVTLTSGAVALALDPLLIFARPLGLPGLGLGVDGAAIVLSAARAGAAALAMFHVVRVHDLAARPRLRAVIEDARPLFAIALPAVLTQLSTPFGNFLLTRAMAEFGDSAVAGWSVVSRMTVLAFGGIFALSGAIGGIIGQNRGAGRMDRVRRAYLDALIFSAVYVGAAWALLASAAGAISRAFSLSETGAEVVRVFGHVGAGGFLFAGALFVANTAFNNLGRPLWSTAFNWARDGAAIPLLLMLLTGPFLAPGVIYAQAAATMAAGAAAAWTGWLLVARLARPAAAEAAPGWGSAPPLPLGRAAGAMPLGEAAGARTPPPPEDESPLASRRDDR